MEQIFGNFDGADIWEFLKKQVFGNFDGVGIWKFLERLMGAYIFSLQDLRHSWQMAQIQDLFRSFPDHYLLCIHPLA